MDRLNTLDAEFLHLEDGIVHMHIAGACIFSDPPPTIEELTALIGSKLHLIPRYRQRVRQVPFELGRPVWVDDPHFEIGYHVRHAALPAPGTDASFCHLMGRLMSQPLDRQRPLWETWLVEGLEGGRWALIFKIHHCMVDGIAGVGLLTVLLDAEPLVSPAPAEPWEPTPEPAGAVKVLDAWAGLAGDAMNLAGRLPAAIAHPGTTLRTLTGTLQGMGRLTARMRSTPALSIEGRIGPHRRWAHSSVGLGDVKAIGSAFDSTVNDVVLAAVSGGYRQLIESRGENPDEAVVRSLVPVSTRHDDGRGVPDNRVTLLLYELPVGVADPVERLSLVHEQMADLKGSHMAEAGEVMTTLGNLAPPMVVAPVSWAAIRAMHQLPQRSINTVTTNVPGPQFPLYCLGREMAEYLPFVPISHGVRVSTAILSYNGRVSFGITGDFATAPDVGLLASATVSEIEVLRQQALTGPATRFSQ